uniref:Hypothetical chloroplast RF1 n=1 Tax=Lobosphaera incisa TaxID=312850 RepID=A0A097KM72_9CHLO|nr:hypothetical chloroplast RF1 [Lobosphaera incisa]AIT94277.1 hypothetical chloroplast RF1 [Lobosphaera incisa]
MSFVPAIRDYIGILNSVYDSFSGDINLQLIIQHTLIYILESIKFILFYLISFQWFRDLCYLPVLVPQLSTAILKENYFLEDPLSNFFSFLETPTYNNNKFLIGFLNSFFLSLPISCSHFICARRLIIQGIPAGIVSGLGNILGQSFFLISVIFGLRFLVIPWMALEPLSYILGIILICTIIYNITHERGLKPIKKYQTTLLFKIFCIHFVLAWTEQSCFFSYLGNLTLSGEPTILETFSSNNQTNFFLIHISYMFGLILGSCVFSTFFGIFSLSLSDFVLKVSTLRFTQWINQLNVFFITITIGFTFASLPYYGLDYLITKYFGFIGQDETLEKTFFSPIHVEDTITILGLKSDAKSIDTDVVPFDRGRYLRLEFPQSFEDLNYQGEYAWTSRKDRQSFLQIQKNRSFISRFFKKAKKDAQVSSSLEKLDSSTNLAKNEKWSGIKNTEISGARKNVKNLDIDESEQNKQILNNKVYISDADLDQTDSDERDDFLEDSNFENQLQNTNLNNRVDEDLAAEIPILQMAEKVFPLEFIDKKDKKGKLSTIFTTRGKKLEYQFKQKYYSNGVYKLLLNAEIDSFLNRQPNSHFLSSSQENSLYEKRRLLANYYDSLRYYNQLPYAEEFKNLFNGSKSYADRIYNQQFKGTLKIVRRLFSISLQQNSISDLDSDNSFQVNGDSEEKQFLTLNDQNKERVLKFDQPLYKNSIYKDNPLLHEELNSFKIKQKGAEQLSQDKNVSTLKSSKQQKSIFNNKNIEHSPFLELTNPVPFYAGWDEQQRKLVVTNRLLPRYFASYLIKYQSNKNISLLSDKNKQLDMPYQKIEFTAWPIPKNVLSLTKSESKIPYTVLFESLNDPKNESLKGNLTDPEEPEYDFINFPPNLKQIEVEDKDLIDLLPPTRGGFIWPGDSLLKFDIKNMLKQSSLSRFFK